MISKYAEYISCENCTHYWFKKCILETGEYYNLPKKPDDVCVKFELVDFNKTKRLNKSNK